jgi:hypothetical protein
MIDYNNPEIQKAIYEYAHSLDLERNKRWGDVSHKFNSFTPFVAVTIQGLGTLDSKLTIEDEILVKTGKPKNPFGNLNDLITQSYLWVLGVYELIRSLEQRAKNDNLFFPKFKQDLKNLKLEFARIRIPLSKFEPASGHADTDSAIAFPAFINGQGIGWKISEQFWISRRELSDKMLNLLEKMSA